MSQLRLRTSSTLRRGALGASLLAAGLTASVVERPTHARVAAPELAARHDRGDALAVTDAPAEIERRLYRHLEEYRAADDAPWHDASVVSAVPLFRPGDAAPTYWEFQLRADDGSPRGFVLLATAEHDFPVPLASAGGEAPTTKLQARARASGQTIHRFYLPMVGHPVAETTAGDVLIGEAGLPKRLTGYDASWVDEPAESFAGSHARAPKIETNLKASSWDSWDALAREYAVAYAIPHALLARSAASEWEIEREVQEATEALALGDVRYVPLLLRHGDAQFSVSGAGADDVEVSRITRGAGEAALRIAVGKPTKPGFERAVIVVDYADGTSESIAYDVGPLPPPSALASPVLASPMLGRAAGAASASAAASLCAGDTVLVRAIEGTSIPVFYPHERKMAMHHRRGDDAAISRVPAVSLEARGGGLAIRDKGGQYWRVSGSSIGRTAVAGEATIFTQSHLASVKIGPLGYPVQRSRLRAPDGKYLTIDEHLGAVLGASAGDVHALCYDTASTAHWAGKDADDAWNRTPSYSQIPAKTGLNTGACSSGCGATAWAMLLGWADGIAHDTTALGHAHWKDDKNLVEGVAPMRPAGRNAVVDAMTWALNRANETWAMTGCVKTLDPLGGDTQYWTAPQVMAQANNYIKKRTSASVTADYDGAGIGTAEGAIKARDVIKQRKRPVVVGEGHLVHYSVAFGYRKYTYFTWEGAKWDKRITRERYESSRGFAQGYSHQIPYHTWFVGWVHPNVDGWDTLDALTSGGSCQTNLACATNRCDVGFNSTGTSRCIPRDGKGVTNEFCTHNNHCTTSVCKKVSGASTGKCTGKQDLGGSCVANGECTSGRCDTGWNSTGTNRCIPHNGTGGANAFCTHSHHCKSGECSGLSAAKKTGTCTSKQPLGGSCQNAQACTSGRCDNGWPSQNTNRCIPHDGAGLAGAYCTHRNHCKSGTCNGLSGSSNTGSCK